MATPKKTTKIGQPEILVAKTIIGRDCVTFSLPKSVLNHVSIEGGESFFCITNGIIQISGQVPCATMPPLVLDEGSFIPQQQ